MVSLKSVSLVVALLLPSVPLVAIVASQPISDGFGYPVGKPYRTEAKDTDGYYDAQDFGDNNHLGEDWNGDGGGNTDLGDPVYAVSNGTITYAQNAGQGWGNVIIIAHHLPDGSTVASMYGHLDQILVSSGDVARGQQIGTIGRGFQYGKNKTGNDIYDYTLSAHLHFELRTDASLGPGPGYSIDKTGRTDPSEFIDSHRVLMNISTSSCQKGITCSGVQGVVFAFEAGGFTPGGAIKRFMTDSVGSRTELAPPPDKADGTGRVTWEFPSSCTTPTGNFSIFAVDVATGKESNRVTETITPGSCLAATLAVTGGTYVDRNTGLIGNAFLFNPITTAGTIDQVNITGPAGWNGGNTLPIFRYQPTGTAANRSLWWQFTAPVAGTYFADAAVGGQNISADFLVDTANRLSAPEITHLTVTPSQVDIQWTASVAARSFLIRLNPIPFTGITRELVLPGNARTATLSGLSLATGAQYQAVVFALSQDILAPDPLVGPFNIGAHGVQFTGPSSSETCIQTKVSARAGGTLLSPGDGLPPVSTGLTVQAGDQVRISASGTITIFGSSPNITNGPNGLDFSAASSFTFLLSDAATPQGESARVAGALIARIDTTPFFYSGYSAQLIAAGSGELELAVNDIAGFFSDNLGEFQVSACRGIPGTLDDDFNDNFLDTTRWDVTIAPPGAGTISETNQRLEMLQTTSGSGYLGLASKCKVHGDFDVQVDLALLNWPSVNFHTVRLVAGNLPQGPIGLTGVYRNSYSNENYQMRAIGGLVANVDRVDFFGRVRLRRTGSTIEGYYWDGTTFVLIGSSPTTADDTTFIIDFAAGSGTPITPPAGVFIAFDNFKVNLGTPVCP
jgi:murein DD-endopeptidase MepM/ murein hydrolase activator NlpD